MGEAFMPRNLVREKVPPQFTQTARWVSVPDDYVSQYPVRLGERITPISGGIQNFDASVTKVRMCGIAQVTIWNRGVVLVLLDTDVKFGETLKVPCFGDGAFYSNYTDWYGTITFTTKSYIQISVSAITKYEAQYHTEEKPCACVYALY